MKVRWRFCCKSEFLSDMRVLDEERVLADLMEGGMLFLTVRLILRNVALCVEMDTVGVDSSDVAKPAGRVVLLQKSPCDSGPVTTRSFRNRRNFSRCR